MANLAAREARNSSFYSGQTLAPLKVKHSITEEETDSAIEEHLNISTSMAK